MKKPWIFLFAALILAWLSSCAAFNGDTLAGTEWRFEFLGSGYGYAFDTSDTGHGIEATGGVWTDTPGLVFPYTYDPVSKSGTFFSAPNTQSFTIEGRVLNYMGVQYTLK